MKKFLAHILIIMKKRGYRVALAASFLTILHVGLSTGFAQINVSGHASSALVKSQGSTSQYGFNDGRATFTWRADLFFDAEVTENILFLSNLRLSQDETIHIDLFTIRFVNLAGPSLNVDLGLIDVPFLNIGDHRYPKTNPFISLPLGREHYTTLRASDYELWNANARYANTGNGFHILDGSLYDIGLKLFGSTGILDYAVALTNGAVSSSGSYSPAGLNSNHGFGKSIRLALTPMIGATLGISYARGPFIDNGSGSYYGTSYSSEHDPAEYAQEIIGLDVDYSFDHISFYGEGFLNRWKFADEYGADLKATGFSGEVRFVPVTRISLAVRIGGLFFNDISPSEDVTQSYPGIIAGPWDRDVVRTEGAFGYRFSRNVLIKAVYQHINTVGVGDDPADDTVALQIVAGF